MRRTLVAAAACAVALLVAVPAAEAATTGSPAPSHARVASPVVHSPLVRSLGERLPFRFVPLARRLSGGGTVDLTVQTYAGGAEAGAQAGWWVTAGDQTGHGAGATDAAGHVAMAGVPAAAGGGGEIAVAPAGPEGVLYDLSGMTWGESGWTGTLRPGRMSLSLMLSDVGDEAPWPQAVIRLYSTSGAETHMARTVVPRDGSQTNASPYTMPLAQENLSMMCINYWSDQGKEIPLQGRSTTPGVTTTTIDKYWGDDCEAIFFPGWASGRPGTKTQLNLANFPLGWTNSLGAVADWPATAKPTSYGDFPSAGYSYEAKDITVPATMAPGYAYWVWADHAEGHLYLLTAFQTCTLKPSRSSVAKNGSLTLSGVVPVKGHYGTHKGTPKDVTIYWTTSSRLAKAGQPSKSGGSAQAGGWIRLGKARTDRLGRFSKGSVKPARTTWYVAWYPGDSQYWGAWTSLTKVTMK